MSNKWQEGESILLVGQVGRVKETQGEPQSTLSNGKKVAI